MGEIKKKCFIITPIGDNNSEIRRHIDGIIDQSIVPAFGEKYDIDVAHRKYEIGSINDRVIRSVFEADLVVANLTQINPNVMFELAIRYSHGKPAIVIAEEGTKLPFDIIDENTLFYVNDPFGANELKIRLIEFEKSIDYKKQTFGPVYKAISKVPLYNEIESGKAISNEKLFPYLIERLDTIEASITNQFNRKTQIFRINVNYEQGGIKDQDKFKEDINELLKLNDFQVIDTDDIENGFVIYFDETKGSNEINEFMNMLEKILKKHISSRYSYYKKKII